MRGSRALLIALVLSAPLLAQETRRTGGAILLDRVAATIGDAPAFGAAMLEAFETLPDPAAYGLAAELWFEGLDHAAPPPDAAARLKAVLEGPSAPGHKRTIAARARRALLARQGAVEALRAERGRDGGIQSFSVIGPFGFAADSLAGFPFPPERGIDPKGRYDGFDGSVSWRPYATPPGSASSNPFDVLSPESGAAYALAMIRVPKDSDLTVALKAEGSAELFVDGRQALSIRKRARYDPATRWVEARFPAGWHALLVKTTDSGIGSFALSLHDRALGPVLVDHGGTLRDDAVCADSAEFHETARAATGLGADGAFVTGDLRTLVPFSGDRASDLATAYLWAQSGLPELAYAAIQGFLDARDLAPGELLIASRVVTMAWHLPENDRKARLLDLAKRAVAKVEGLAPAVSALAQHEAQNDRAEEGIELAQAAVAKSPGSVELWDTELEILQTVGFESDHDRVLDAALEACPGAPRLLGRRLTQLEKKRAWPAWIEAASRLLAANAASPHLAQSLGARLLAARRFDDLKRLLEVQRALHPHDLALASLEADLLHEQGDLEGEKRALEAIATSHPKDTSALRTLADRALAAGDEQGAIVHLERALIRDGDLGDVRRLLAKLRPPPHDYFAEFLVDSDAFLAQAPGKDAYPDSRIVLLLDQIVLWVHPDGSAEQEVHQIHRLQDARGKQELGTIHADGEVKVVQTILPDGRKLVPNQVGRGAYEMAGLAPGVCVERRYRRHLDRFKGRPESFGGFYFQDTRLLQPFHYTRYVVIVPGKLGLEPVVERFEAKPKREERGDDVVWGFLLERVPRIQKEALMPRPEDLVPHVEFRRPDEWNEINRRYRDVYEPAWRPTPPIEEAAKNAVGDATDPVEKARRLYEFLMDTVTSNEGSGWPTQTLLEKSGDRFPLYLALLRASGVPHALVMGRAQEKVSPPINWQLVSEELFDVPMVRIEPPGKDPVYVSTDLRYLPFGRIRYELTDAPVFVTSDEGGRIERTPAAPLEDARAAQIEMDLALDAAGAAEGTVRLTLGGPVGAWFKEQIERTDKKRLEQMAAGMILGPIGRLAPKPKGAVRLENATSRSGPLVIAVDVEMKQLVRKTDGGGTIGMPFAPLLLAKALVDRKERKLPFVFHQYLVQDDEARITLDPAWKPDELPPDFERKGPLGTYRLRRSADGAKLTFRRQVALTPADVLPADFPGVASFAKDVDEAEAGKLTLRRETQ